jgi:hypothetical protein
MSASFQQITLTLVVKEEDVEAVKRELNQSLDCIGEEYQVHNDKIEEEDCDSPESEDLYEFEDAA